jgi:putative hemolysin
VIREGNIGSELLIILALVLLNGLFSGAEIATISIRKTRLQELVDAGNSAARAVLALREKPERFLATVQVGITVVGVAASAFGGARVAAHLAPFIAHIPGLETSAEQIALTIVVVGISFLTLVLGELVPKSLALRAGERYALLIGRPLLGLAWLARPIVWFLTASSNVVLRLFGDRTSFTESRLSTEELLQLVEEASKSGSLDPQAGEIASRALEFAELTSSDVMVPRNEVVALPKNASIEEVRRVLLEQGHNRIPVYDVTIDNVVGYISIKDVIALAWESQLIIMQDLLRPAYFVPDTMKAVALLREMQARHMHLAIVVDEAGGMAGIVTMEDIVEELVGEIVSEHSTEATERVQVESDGAWVVQGSAQIRDVNRATGLELPEGESWSTIAGLCITLAGHIPSRGHVLKTESGIELEVVESTARRVRLVRVRRPRPPEEPEQSE